MTRIDELLAEIKRVRAEMQSRGILSDPGRLDSRLMKLLDELAFIVKGQFKEINKLKAKLRKVTKAAEKQEPQKEAAKKSTKETSKKQS